MLYIDFDGVILDTDKILFEKWEKNPVSHLLPESEKIKYIQNSNWNYVLNNSAIINDSVYYLKQMNPKNSFILTKIHSTANEGYEKVRWIRSQGIKQSVILVPYLLRKSDMVSAEGNILIDDCLKNLDDWTNNKGIGILFDINDDNYDSWNQPNTKGYEKVLSLSNFKNY